MKDKLNSALCAGWFSLWCSWAAFGQTTDPALVLHLEFDEGFPNASVLDSSGHNNDGWQFNSTNLLTETNGIFGGKAARFQYVGVLTNDYPHIYQFSQYIALTNLDGFEYLTNGTISLWAQFSTNNDNGIFLLDSAYDTIYSGNPSASSNSWTLGRKNLPWLSFFTYPASGGTRTIVNWPNDVVRSGGSNPDFSTANIHLYTVTLDCPNDRAVAYHDGKPAMTNTIGVPWLRVYGCPSIRWLCVGASSHNGTPYWGDDKYPNAGFFVGRLDDLRIYNRTLSASEVMALYLGAGTPAQIQSLAAKVVAPELLEVSWVGSSNAYYQVEWRSNLVSGAWSNLGSPVYSSGGTNSITNSMTGQAMRFYRVHPLP